MRNHFIKVIIKIFMLSLCLHSFSSAFAQTPPTAAPTQTQSPISTQEEEIKSIFDAPELKARDIYNLAVNSLGQTKLEEAAEGFLKARDLAANDNELRYSAAYNLAYTLAKVADSTGDPNQLEEEALNQVLEKLKESAAWFRDAARQKPASLDAKINLELVLKRIQTISDLINTKFNTLERKLESLIQEERKLREDSRLLSDKLQEMDAKKEPLAFSEQFKALASNQQFSITQANLVAEIASNQRALLESKSEDQLSQEEAYRKFQLTELSSIFEQARQSMLQARRSMRNLSIEDSLRHSSMALNLLKQSRETLQNPVQTLHELIQDQVELLRLSNARDTLQKTEQTKPANELKVPDWLSPSFLNDTQSDLLVRTNRVGAFFSAMERAPVSEEEKTKPEIQKQRQQISAALPFVLSAAEAMQRATVTLPDDNLMQALKDETVALDQLTEAAERFTDLKRLVELSYAQQTGMRDLIDLKINNTNEENETQKTLSLAEVQSVLTQGTDKNISRLERLADMIAEESAKSQAGGGEKPLSEEEQMKIQALYEHAEKLRERAVNENKELKERLSFEALPEEGALTQGEAQEVQTLASWNDPANRAQKTLEELRIIFFSIVEHIQELARQQEKTLDNTADSAVKAKDFDPNTQKDSLEMLVQPISERQTRHEALAEEIGRILAEQAQQLQNGQAAQNQEQALEMSQRYTQASGELQAAAAVMRQAKSDLSAMLFTETMEGQKTALEHLMKAIEILQPPQQKEQQSEDSQQEEEKKEMSQEQADKKLQQIREREKERQKRQQKPSGGQAAVEKDW